MLTPHAFISQGREFLSTTKGQRLDVIGGIFLPVLCVVADPIVFKQSEFFGNLGGPLLQRYVVFGYLEILIGMTALALFLQWRIISPFLAGTLLVGAVFSLALGTLLFPFAILGLLFVIGILGFTPFLSCFVFARACIRALQICRTRMKTRVVVAYASLGVVLTLALPIGSQIAINSVVDDAVQGILAGDSNPTGMLRALHWATDLSPLVTAYLSEKDETRKQYLAQMYEEITGTDIENRIAALAD
jgi:hypothetical protein